MNVEAYAETCRRDRSARIPAQPEFQKASVLAAKPVPILLTVRELDYGGIQRDVTRIALKLDRSRFEPHVATYQTNGIRVEELNRAGVPILHIPISSLKSPTVLIAAIRMRRFVHEHGIRLVHAFDTSAVFVVPMARALRVPAVLSSTLGSRDLLDLRSRRQMRWTDRMVDAVMVNCEAMRRHLIDDEHISGERIELCYNGVTEEFFPAHPPCPEAFSNASIVIGTVCALRPEKALSLLQEAFSQVLHLDPGMKLVFVGSGPQLSLLQKNASRLGIENSNVFIPAADDVATWLRSMNIFVSASISEAFSNALLEAMACGCSVVGSRVGGTPELIGNNEERGFLFKSGNVADLVDKLSRLIINPNLRRDLGRRAATFVRENLTIEIAAERTAAIYEKLLVRKTGCQIPVSVIGRQGCLTVR